MAGVICFSYIYTSFITKFYTKMDATSENGRFIRKLELKLPGDSRMIILPGKTAGPDDSLVTNIEREVVGPNITYTVWCSKEGLAFPWKSYDNMQVAVEYDYREVI